MANRFFRVSSSVTLDDRKVVWWQMHTGFRPTGAVTFFVDRARSGGEWEQLSAPLVGVCHFVDPSTWNWGMDRNTWYRVRFQEAGEWVFSMPAWAPGEWDPQDYRHVHEICRKERLLLRLAGMPGVLMKRRAWGEPCATCLDYDTRQPTRRDCPECYGTGIVGGYYAPIPMAVLNPEPRKDRRAMAEGAGGLSQQSELTVRCLAYPFVEQEDMWFGLDTGRRWRIMQVTPAADLRGKPVIWNMRLGLLPMTDMAYSAAMSAKALTPPEPPGESGSGTEYIWECPPTDEPVPAEDRWLDGGEPDTDFGDMEEVDGGLP